MFFSLINFYPFSNSPYQIHRLSNFVFLHLSGDLFENGHFQLLVHDLAGKLIQFFFLFHFFLGASHCVFSNHFIVLSCFLLFYYL